MLALSSNVCVGPTAAPAGFQRLISPGAWRIRNGAPRHVCHRAKSCHHASRSSLRGKQLPRLQNPKSSELLALTHRRVTASCVSSLSRFLHTSSPSGHAAGTLLFPGLRHVATSATTAAMSAASDSGASTSPTPASFKAHAQAQDQAQADHVSEEGQGISELQSRLLALQQAMARSCQGQGVDAFVVPAEDQHQCEYRAPCFERLRFISGFTGSAGTAVVTAHDARLWTDGRYFLQARQQLPPSWELMKAGLPGVPTVTEWLADVLPPGSRVGIDPFLHTAESESLMSAALAAQGSSLVFVPKNLVDGVWGGDRPKEPLGELWVHPMEYAGHTVEQKVADLQRQMKEAGADVLVTGLLDEVAWLFNVRGRDVPHCPVAIAYAAVTENGARLFIDRRKLTAEVESHLASANVAVDLYTGLLPFIAEAAEQGKSVWMDPTRTSAVLFAAFYGTLDLAPEETKAHVEKRQKKAQEKARKGKGGKGGKKDKGGGAKAGAPGVDVDADADSGVVENGQLHGDASAGRNPRLITLPSPIALEKSCKNEAEIEGMRRAHLRDAVALARFWTWLEEEVVGEARAVSEVEVGLKLEEFRAEEEGFVETSFDTIAGANSNGAIIHYCAQPGTCSLVDNNTMLLLDSGGQYVDGTTDVTRTVHLGTPSAYQKVAFTRVLQGNMALDRAVFPEGTPGFVLDVLARKSLWRIGLDYRHGTGHGVGACLNVHEGPQGISPRFGNPTALQPGMVVSNEPGYYDDGQFGIRIENLLVVREEPTEYRFGGVNYLGFDRLTLVPIQAKMIDLSILSEEEVAWVDDYHKEVWEKVSPRLQGQDQAKALDWLRQNTRPLREQVCTSAGNELAVA